MTAHLYSYSDSRLPAHAPHCWTTPSTPGDDEFDFADCEPRQTRTPARGHEVLGKQMRDLQDNLDELIGITQDQISLSRRDYSRMDRKVDDLASQVQAVLTAVKAPATQFKPLPTLSELVKEARKTHERVKAVETRREGLVAVHDELRQKVSSSRGDTANVIPSKRSASPDAATRVDIATSEVEPQPPSPATATRPVVSIPRAVYTEQTKSAATCDPVVDRSATQNGTAARVLKHVCVTSSSSACSTTNDTANNSWNNLVPSAPVVAPGSVAASTWWNPLVRDGASKSSHNDGWASYQPRRKYRAPYVSASLSGWNNPDWAWIESPTPTQPPCSAVDSRCSEPVVDLVNCLMTSRATTIDEVNEAVGAWRARFCYWSAKQREVEARNDWAWAQRQCGTAGADEHWHHGRESLDEETAEAVGDSTGWIDWEVKPGEKQEEQVSWLESIE